MGIPVDNSVGQNEGSVEGSLVVLSVGSLVGLPVGTVVGESIGADDDDVMDGSLVGRLVGPDVRVSKLDDDMILFVSFNCSDWLSRVWSLGESFSIYDKSNTRFKFIRVIESRKDQKSYNSIHSPDDVSIDRRLGCWIIANDNDNNNKIDKRNNIFLCSWRYERLHI